MFSYQTVRIARGKHDSPADGACVMELASLLANERFTDHPRSVCPTLAAFLRAYNDVLPDDLRPDLYGVAGTVVGTASTPQFERHCGDRLVEWGRLAYRSRRLRVPWGPRFPSTKLRERCSYAGAAAACAAARDTSWHARTLEFIAELAASAHGGAADHRSAVEDRGDAADRGREAARV